MACLGFVVASIHAKGEMEGQAVLGSFVIDPWIWDEEA